MYNSSEAKRGARRQGRGGSMGNCLLYSRLKLIGIVYHRARDGAKSGSGFGWWAKNQMWNLKAVPKLEGMTYDMVHKAIEGKAFNWPLYKRIFYGTPLGLKLPQVLLEEEL